LTAASTTTVIESNIMFERKIKLVTEGLFDRYFKLLSKLQPKQMLLLLQTLSYL